MNSQGFKGKPVSFSGDRMSRQGSSSHLSHADSQGFQVKPFLFLAIEEVCKFFRLITVFQILRVSKVNKISFLSI